MTPTVDGLIDLLLKNEGGYVNNPKDPGGATKYGVSLRFLVDTGATSVVLSSADARRAGLNYLAGTRSFTQTANGVIPVYYVKLDSIRVGDITLNSVDAAVIEGDKLPIALLGMSFLNRMEMRRDGITLTLIRRY